MTSAPILLSPFFSFSICLFTYYLIILPLETLLLFPEMLDLHLPFLVFSLFELLMLWDHQGLFILLYQALLIAADLMDC